MNDAAKEQTHPDAALENVTNSSHELKVRVAVADILKGRREAVLVHDGMDYRLRITANGKLILTK